MKGGLVFVLVAGVIAVYGQAPDVDPRFHTYGEVCAEAAALAESHPEICRIETLAYSTQDSVPIVGVIISDNVDEYEDESAILIVAGQHAREPLGTEVSMWLINYLVETYGTDPQVTEWVDSFNIVFVPVDNPEGRNVVMEPGPEHTLWWRKNKRDNNGNGVFDTLYDGVDPNRNYDYRWEEYGGTDPGSEYYKGEHPWSEAESRLVRDLVDSLRPAVVMDLHSPDSIGGNKLWFCWYDSAAHSYHQGGFPHYYDVALQLAAHTETEVDGEYYVARPANNIKPKLQLWTYWYSGACAILMEITNKCFWHGDTIDTIAARVGRGITYMFDRMLEKGLIVRAYDSENDVPLRAEVIIDGVTDTTFPARLCAVNGRYHRLLYAGTYTVRVRYDTLEQAFENVRIDGDENTYIEVDFPSAGVRENHTGTDIDIELLLESVRFVAPAGEVSIYDISGRRVYYADFLGVLNVSRKNFNPGVYFARLKSNKCLISKKFVVIK